MNFGKTTFFDLIQFAYRKTRQRKEEEETCTHEIASYRCRTQIQNWTPTENNRHAFTNQILCRCRHRTDCQHREVLGRLEAWTNTTKGMRLIQWNNDPNQSTSILIPSTIRNGCIYSLQISLPKRLVQVSFRNGIETNFIKFELHFCGAIAVISSDHFLNVQLVAKREKLHSISLRINGTVMYLTKIEILWNSILESGQLQHPFPSVWTFLEILIAIIVLQQPFPHKHHHPTKPHSKRLNTTL